MGKLCVLWIVTLGMCAALGGGTVEGKEGKKVVFIAGTKSHGPGAHEYVLSLKLLEAAIKSVEPGLLGGTGVRTEFYYDGWLKDETKLDDADVIVLFSDGSNHKTDVHPLLEDDRLEDLGKQMARGCGLVVLHYSTFVPNGKAGDLMLDWVGGYFDYQSSTVDPRGHWSKHKTVDAKLKPAGGGHAITRGVKSLAMREELYWNMRFGKDDKRVRPVLMAEIPGEPKDETVAWAVERKDGGRGFAYTGVHFHDNLRNEMIRKMLANGILWVAGYEVPAKGFETALIE